MSKATHRGTCQACGATQKLPDGRLSTHGYTKRWGFFQGICFGTGHLPFEESKELIEQCIFNAQEQIASLEAKQVELRKPTEGPKAFIRHHSYGYTNWIETDITMDGNGFKYTGPDKREKSIALWELGNPPWPTTLAETCTRLNASRAADYEKGIREMRSYVKWQQERIKNWKPEPAKLQPVTK